MVGWIDCLSRPPPPSEFRASVAICWTRHASISLLLLLLLPIKRPITFEYVTTSLSLLLFGSIVGKWEYGAEISHPSERKYHSEQNITDFCGVQPQSRGVPNESGFKMTHFELVPGFSANITFHCHSFAWVSELWNERGLFTFADFFSISLAIFE